MFGFKNASAYFQDEFRYQDWLQRLYDELKVAKAVMFVGQSKGGGHAFVIDGYDKEDFFHVNWGWSGICDGMYRISSLQPIQQGAGGAVGDDNGYRMMQTFYTGLYPDAPSPKQDLRVEIFQADEEAVIEPENGKFEIPSFALRVCNISMPTMSLYSQTTKSREEYQRLIDNISIRLPEGADFIAFDTVCNRVANRARDLEGFARSVDVLLFVAGSNSSNGHYLYEYCRKVQPNTHLIATAEEVQPQWFEGASSVGISGATSTPRWLMEDVKKAIS